MIIFETKRLTVRQFTEDDGDFFAEMNGDPEVMRYIRPVKTKEESLKFLSECIALYDVEKGMGRWIAIEKESQKAVGSVAVFPLKGTHEIQIGYSFLKPYWGRGFAKEAVEGCIKYATECKHKSIVAVTEQENIASQKVLLANGFSYEGIHNAEDKPLSMFRFNL